MAVAEKKASQASTNAKSADSPRIGHKSVGSWTHQQDMAAYREMLLIRRF